MASFRTVVVCGLCLCLLSSVASAQVLSSVQVTVERASDSQVLEDVVVEVWDTNGLPLDSVEADANGVADFDSLEPGTYDFLVFPQESPSCAECGGLAQAIEEDVVIQRSGAEYTQGTDTFVLGDDFSLTEAAKKLRVTVKDSNNTAISNLRVNGFLVPEGLETDELQVQALPDQDFFAATTDSNGQVLVAVTEGRWIVDVISFNGNFVGVSDDVEIPSADGTADLALTVERADATLDLLLVDENEDEIFLESGEEASVSCYDSTFTRFFFKEYQTGSDTATVKVVGGPEGSGVNYICELYYEGKAANQVEITAVSDETEEGLFFAQDASCNISAGFISSEGAQLTDVEAEVFAFTVPESNSETVPSVIHYSQDAEANESGRWELPVICDAKYEVTYFLFPSEEENATQYIDALEFVTLSPTVQNNPLSQNFTLITPNATAIVTVTDENGQPVDDAIVELVSDENPAVAAQGRKIGRANDEAGGIFLVGETDSTGVVRLQGIAGVPYSLSVFLEDAFVDDDTTPTVLNPPAQQVTLQEGENNLSPQALTPNYTLTVTVTAPSGVTLEDAFCAAFSDAAFGYADAADGTAEIALLSDDTDAITYSVYCEGASGEVYYSGGPVEHVAEANSTTGSASVTLASFGTFIPTDTVTFNPMTSQSINLPNGGVIDIPANSFVPSGGGNVTLVFGSNTAPTPFTSTIQPLGALLELRVNDSEGNKLQLASGRTVTLTLPYDEALLPLGVTEDQLKCLATNQNAIGLSITDCEIDTTSNTAKYVVSHFSDFGLNRAASIVGGPDAPSVRTKRRSGKGCNNKTARAAVIFEAVSDAVSYTVSGLRAKGSKSKALKDKTVTAQDGKTKYKVCVPARKNWRTTVTVRGVDEDGNLGGGGTVRFKRKKKNDKLKGL